MQSKKRKWLWILLGVLAILIILAALAPTVVSTGLGRKFALRRINARLPGALDVDGWKLRWSKSIELNGLTYVADAGDLRMSIPSMKCSKGLYHLWQDAPHAGTIVIIRPEVDVKLPETGQIAPPRRGTQPAATSASTTSTSANSKPAASPIALPPILAHVMIHDATLRAFSAKEQNRNVLNHLNLDFDLEGLDKPIRYDISAQTGSSEESNLSCKGTLTLENTNDVRAEEVHTDTILNIKDWVIDDTSAVLTKLYGFPAIRGNITATLGLSGSREKGLRVLGESHIQEFRMSGERTDELVDFGDIDVDVDANVLKSGLDLAGLNVQSSFCRLNASGSLGGSEEKTFTASMESDLHRLVDLLDKFNLVPEDLTLAGHLEARASASSGNNMITIDSLKADANNFVFRYGLKSFRDTMVSLSTAGRIELLDKTIRLNPMDVTTSFGHMDLDEVVIGDYTKWPATLKATGNAQTDLTSLARVLEESYPLPEHANLSGGVKGKFTYGVPEKGRHQILSNLEFSNLQVESPNWPPIDEKQVRMTTDFELRDGWEDVAFKQLFIASLPLSLDVAGTYRRDGPVKKLTADGRMAYALPEIARYMNRRSGMNLVMQGKNSKPIKVESEWTGNRWQDFLRHADMDVELQADTIKVFGMRTDRLTIPAYLRAGAGRVYFDAAINEGVFAMKPTIDFTRDPPMILLPKKSQIVSNMRLDNGMADDMLALIHPIFRRATVTRGSMSLTIDRCLWPLDRDRNKQAALAGSMQLNNVRLRPTGMVQMLLEELDADDQEISIAQNDFTFVVKDGIVACSPMILQTDRIRIILTGAMTTDGTLSYQAKVPITEELVGEKLYRYAKGITVNIPIGGTKFRPVIDASTVADVLADLATQAAKKAIEEEASQLLMELFK